MKPQIIAIILSGILFTGCAGMMNMSGQAGSDYHVEETYDHPEEKVFETVEQLIEEDKENRFLAWKIATANESNGTIETEWKTTGGSGSVSGGRTLDEDSNADDRVKINIEVAEDSLGTKVSMQLQNQHKFTGNPNASSEWREMDVDQEDIDEYLMPLKEEIDDILNQ